MNKNIKEVTSWFIEAKAPDLKDKIEIGLKQLADNLPLEGNYKKMFGFMLFSFAMNHGPASFIGIEFLAEDLKITDEFKEYANDWINHSNKTKQTVTL